MTKIQAQAGTPDPIDDVMRYLLSGGLFNPESMNHEQVRDLVIRLRDEVISARKSTDVERRAAERCAKERDEARAFAESAAIQHNALLEQRRKVTCVYCGHVYPDGTPTEQDAALTTHIESCEKHPLFQARAEIEKLRTERDNALAKAHDEWMRAQQRSAAADAGYAVVVKQRDDALFYLKHNAQTLADLLRLSETWREPGKDVLAGINPGDYVLKMEEKLRKPLLSFIETIEATGGVNENLEPAADEDWQDLGEAYAEACSALGVPMKINKEDE